MPLIDKTYFKGSISLAQLGQADVVNNLNVFINQHEPLLLQACLGYELWEDFVAGLSEPIIDQKWLDIRDGATFQASGLWPPFYWRYPYLDVYRNWYIPQNPQRRMRWVGFTGPQATNFGSNVFGDMYTLTADGSTNNPVPGTSTFTWNRLAGQKYYIERKPTGTMEVTDVSITNNGQTITLLQPGDKFNTNEKFILHFFSGNSVGTPSLMYPSPIANYVYYQWFRDNAAELSAFGVVSAKSENSTVATGLTKMSDAFNQCSKDIFHLWQFLEAKGVDVYPNYDRLKIDYNFFKPINKYGI